MSNFKERLVEEQIQLEDKLKKLNAFNQSDKVNEITTEQKNLLLIQAGIVYSYNEVLKARLSTL